MPEAIPELDYIFRPRSIAVAGASASNGGVFVSPLQEIGFPGPIYIIHPSAKAIRGLRCYASLLDVPDDVDYVVSSVPARMVRQLLEECIARHVKVLHLFTAGFSETGDAERAEMEQAIVTRAKAGGVRIIGPNCMGIYAPASRLAMQSGQLPEAGPVGMISQSGMNAVDFVRYSQLRGIRFSKVISFGNGADLKAADFFEYLSDDPETEIIVAYLEGIQDGPRLARAMRRAGTAKPMAIYKGGGSEAGSRAANSHTASLAGSRQVFDALCRQAGALCVDNLEELVAAAVTFRLVKHLRGPNAVVVGLGGGISVQAADDLEAEGLKVPMLLPDTQTEIQKVTAEAGTSVRNPVDTTALWDPQLIEATLMPCATAANCDFVFIHTSFGSLGPTGSPADTHSRMAQQVDAFRRVQDKTGTPIVVAIRSPITADGFSQGSEFQELCWKAELATYPGIPRAARALGGLLRWQRLRGW